MVAKSYQTLEIVGDPYNVSSRMYVKVRTKTGALKQIRWYTENEYYKMYPEERLHKEFKTQKEILGFDKGYITIFKGNTYEDKEYFKNNSARYNKLWGWYFVSTEELPDDIPDDVTPVQLPWEVVGAEDGKLYPEDTVKAAIEFIIYDPDPSQFQGQVGEKVNAVMTVESAITLDGYYGLSTMHVMRDENNNCYVWTTSAKSWEVGSTHNVTGTIKALRTYHGVRQTVLTRCRAS